MNLQPDKKKKERCVLLATDFSPSAQHAFAYAVSFATALKARLVILTVVKALPWAQNRPSLHGRHTAALLELGRLARMAAETSLTVRPNLVLGVPSATILEIAQEVKATLVVMGTHGRTGWDRLELGSTAEAVVRTAHCPVLTVRGTQTNSVQVHREPISLRRVLVPIDLSACADRALAYGGKLAEQFGAHIRILHVNEKKFIDPLKILTVTSTKPIPRQAQLSQRLRRRILTFQRHYLQSDFVIKPGSPRKVILTQAKEYASDMIVIGTHGRHGVARMMFGSVAAYVVRHSSCPVLTVKIP